MLDRFFNKIRYWLSLRWQSELSPDMTERIWMIVALPKTSSIHIANNTWMILSSKLFKIDQNICQKSFYRQQTDNSLSLRNFWQLSCHTDTIHIILSYVNKDQLCYESDFWNWIQQEIKKLGHQDATLHKHKKEKYPSECDSVTSPALSRSRRMITHKFYSFLQAWNDTARYGSFAQC